MSIKKLTFYLEDAIITLKSDHLPLKKILEISPFCINFEYIKGIKNTQADTMSLMIDIDVQVKPEPEPEGYEFGYYTFDSLPALEVQDIQTSSAGSTQNDNTNGNLCFQDLLSHI